MGIFIDTVELGDYGEAAFTTPGTYTWTCPPGVTSVSVVCIGGGQGGLISPVTGGTNYYGGYGGALSYKNNISVVPGNTYTVVVGAGSEANTSANRLPGGNTYFLSTSTVFAPGGGTGASRVGDGGGDGGNDNAGGGGAGGYTAKGGDGGLNITDGDPGGGGSGGGGAGDYSGGSAGIGTAYSGAGGGVGIYGLGADGVGGDFVSGIERYDGRMNGTAGSGGSGTTYGGGGGWTGSANVAAGNGAVRIIWGRGRTFPNTFVQLTSTLTQEELVFSGGGSNLVTIGPGIIMGGDLLDYAPPVDLIRDALSESARISYDAATTGNFVRVSAADYNNVKNNLANTKTIGDNADAILFAGSSYTGTCAALNTPANSNVDPGFYIIGFVARHQSTSGANFRYLVSDSARGTYVQLANQALVTNVTSSSSYYLRKAPTDANVSTVYVGIVANNGNMLQSNTNWANGAFNCATSNVASFTAPWNTRLNATQPLFQTLLCGTRQW